MTRFQAGCVIALLVLLLLNGCEISSRLRSIENAVKNNVTDTVKRKTAELDAAIDAVRVR